MMVFDPVGNGLGRLEFPAFTPQASSDIGWMASIADDDADADVDAAAVEVTLR
jgi:hypothetical protein